jgi:hypothetical protein
MFLLYRLLHGIDSHKHLLHGIVVSTNILHSALFDQSPLDNDKAKNTDQHPHCIVQDVGGEIPQALIGRGVLVCERDGDGQVDEMGQHLRDALL